MFLYLLLLLLLSFLLLIRRYLGFSAISRQTTSSNLYTNSRPDIPHGYTRHQIYEASFILRQKLPRELVTPILNHAEYWLKSYWLRSTTRGQSHRTVQQYIGGGNYQYLHSGRIGNDKWSGPRPVMKVVFVTESKDQGWSDYQDKHGTYEDSWTWFEARARDVTGQDGTPRKGMEYSYPTGGPEEAALWGSVGREVTRNIHAGKDWHTHVVTWAVTDDDENGKWVRELRKGQRILLSAHARYPGWTNNVKSAEIHLYTAAVR